MNSAVKLALAGAMSIASVSGVALAQTADPMVDTTATTNSTTMTSESVSIVRLDSLDNDQNRQEHTRLEQLSNNSESMTEAQSMISSDPAIAQALQAESVQATNVFHIETAANGGKIVYVK
jgi:TolA-binding protein